MTLPELCIRRPVMTTLLMLAFVVFGMFSYKLLPVAALPRVDFPTIVVTAQLPGASPDSMASAVATPLEQAFSNIAGIDSMVSSSGQGATAITIQFDLARNIDGAALDVESEISAAARYLPPQLPAPPSFIKLNPADGNVYNGRGTARALLGDHVAAVADAREAVRHDGAKARVNYNAARIYAFAASVASGQAGAKSRQSRQLAASYEDTAVRLVREEFKREAPEKRAAFWTETVQGDPAFKAIRRRLKFEDLIVTNK